VSDVIVEGIWGNGLLQKSMCTLYLPAGRSFGIVTFKDFPSDLFLICAHSSRVRIAPAIAPPRLSMPSLRKLTPFFTPKG
jgi:hypothetical protein